MALVGLVLFCLCLIERWDMAKKLLQVKIDLSELESPPFDDWERNARGGWRWWQHIPDELVEVWSDLSIETKKAVYMTTNAIAIELNGY